jgi:hypothetical protein
MWPYSGSLAPKAVIPAFAGMTNKKAVIRGSFRGENTKIIHSGDCRAAPDRGQ